MGLPSVVGIRPFIGAKARPLTNRIFERTPARLERGRYLVTSTQTPCLLCHSPIDSADGILKVKEGMALAGRNWEPDGVPFVTAPNLTPDPETGAGGWTDDQLARAIREGIGHDGRTLFPIMPYESYRNMSDEDLASIVVSAIGAGAESAAAIERAVPGEPPDQRRTAADHERSEAGPVDAGKRGLYITKLAICADCHSPADDQGQPGAGDGFRRGIPSCSRVPNGRGGQSDAVGQRHSALHRGAVLETIRTGKVRSRELAQIMPARFFRNFTDQDLKDVFAYLKSLKPVDHFVDNTETPTKCARCGLTHGGGERNKKVSS